MGFPLCSLFSFWMCSHYEKLISHVCFRLVQNKQCGFRLANKFAQHEFFKFFITKDDSVRTNEFARIPIFFPSKPLNTSISLPSPCPNDLQFKKNIQNFNLCHELLLIMTAELPKLKE